MSKILLELGIIDILVLCAATHHRRVPAMQLSGQEIFDNFSTNVIAPFALAKQYLDLPLPVAQRKTIIQVSSAAGQMRAPLRSAYGPSKAAITQVMQHLAFEHKGEANVFSIHPGAFYTPSSAEIYPEGAMKWEDIELPGHFARWLAGPESEFLSGRFLWAQWDVDELIALKKEFLKDQSLSTIGLVL